MASYSTSDIKKAAKQSGSNPAVGERVLVVKSLSLQQRVEGTKGEWEKVKVSAGDGGKVIKSKGPFIEVKMTDSSAKGKVVYFTKDQVVSEKAVKNLEMSYDAGVSKTRYYEDLRLSQEEAAKRGTTLELADEKLDTDLINSFAAAFNTYAISMFGPGGPYMDDMRRALRKIKDKKTAAAALKEFRSYVVQLQKDFRVVEAEFNKFP